MEAMNFEYLIRGAFQCGRYGMPGANADIYRSFEHACYNYDRRDQLKSEKKEEAIFEYARYIGIITTHIEHAIDNILKEYKDTISNAEETILKGTDNLFIEPNRDKIEKYFKAIEPILIKLRVYPIG